MFTFITTNPTVVYDEPQTRMVRVMYKLEPDPENASTFILVHQQSEDLDPKHFISGAYNAIRSYPILKGIKTLQCTFLIPKVEDEKEEAEGANKGPEEKKEDEKSSVKDKKEKKEKKARQFETLKEWKEEAEEEKEKKDKPTSESDSKNKKDEKSSAKDKESKKDKKERPDIPSFIHITLSVYDDLKIVRTYDYWFAPLYDIQPFEIEDAPKEDKKSKSA